MGMEGPGSMEGAPSKPLDNDLVAEREPVSLDKAREAYQAGNMETFNEWLTARQEANDSNNRDGLGRIQLDIDLARIQHAAGETADALERLAGEGGTGDAATAHIEGLQRLAEQATDKAARDALIVEIGKMEEVQRGVVLLVAELRG